MMPHVDGGSSYFLNLTCFDAGEKQTGRIPLRQHGRFAPSSFGVVLGYLSGERAVCSL